MGMSPAALKAYLARQRRCIEKALRERLPRKDADALDAAIRYALLGGGKRLRPALTLAACESVGGAGTDALPYACAVEMIHAYSLVHDDLPAMDDDDLRRGRPTVHIAFSEAIAVLAGDALLTDAFSVAAGDGSDGGFAPAKRLRLVRELARAAGSAGMVRGQARDVGDGSFARTPDALETTHRRKTGDLIRCAVRIGAIAGDASRYQLAQLSTYAESIGLAFQIADDLLDAIGSTATTGKRVRRDAALAKTTFPGLLGVERARERARELVGEALGALRRFDGRADPLRALARHTVARVPGGVGLAPDEGLGG